MHLFGLHLSRLYADACGVDLHLHPGSRRRRRSRPPRSGRDRDCAHCAHRLGMARPPGRHAFPRGMTVLALDVEKQLGEFAISARFETGRGATAVFGPSGAGKTTLVNMIAGLVTPDRGRITLADTVLFDSKL